MNAVSSALVQLISLCAFSAVLEQVLSGQKLLSSIRLLSGILLIGAMVNLLARVLESISF